MKGLSRPVGNQAPDVYWRRRLVVLAALTVLVLLAWLVVRAVTATDEAAAAAAPTAAAAPDAGDSSAAPSASASAAAQAASPTASPTATPDAEAPAATVACTDADLDFTMTADPFTVAADADPVFAVTITQVGSVPCVLDAAGEDTTLMVTSGDARIWFSGDCPAETQVVGKQWLLEPGATQEIQITWPRVRSAEGCEATDSEALPGYYWADLTVQGIAVDKVQFRIL